MERRKSKQIKIGDVKIGGDAPVSVQSMCNTDTRDVEKTVAQIKELQNAGCELIRVAVLNKDAADAIKEIKKKIEIPLIADIHFDYRLALQCIDNGVDALRLNPGIDERGYADGCRRYAQPFESGCCYGCCHRTDLCNRFYIRKTEPL